MNSLIEALYEQSPVPVQDLLISAYGWKLRSLRYGGGFHQYLSDLLASERWPAAEIRAFQDEQLHRLIRHCYENVPYYERLLRQLGLTPDDFRVADDLQKLPTLSKETVRANSELFHARNIPVSHCEVVGTSGTTGKTLRIRVDLEGRRKNYAFFARLKHWAGVEWNARTATFAGRTIIPSGQQGPPFWRYNRPMRTLLFSSYHLAAQNLPAYVEQLNRFAPELIDSYPSSLYQITRFCRDSGAAAPRPRAVITSSETLTPGWRELISGTLNTRIFDQYGSAEQVCFVSQCEHGSYHSHPEYGITELLPAEDSNSGARRIVGTGFTNWAMPLLRYETGDLAIPSTDGCSCGRNFPLLEGIAGRADDVVITPDGRRIGRLDPVFKGLESVRQAQIVQVSLGELKIRLVAAPSFVPAHEQSIRHELERRLGREMRLDFEMVDEIPCGPGGKFRSVISLVKKREVTNEARSGLAVG